MLTTERPWTLTTAAATSSTGYELRLHGGTEVEQLISIPTGKHSIGSGPRCSLRLQYEGVRPLECLIIRNAKGLSVRRWSDDALLNGLPFDEANLADGDVLSIGPVDMEVVVPQPEELFAEVADSATERVDAALAGVCAAEADLPCVEDVETQVLQPTEARTAWDCREAEDKPTAATETTTSNEVAGARRIATSIARRRSRRLLATIRRQRNEFEELVGRVSELERQAIQAIADSECAVPDSANASDAPTQQAEARTETDAESELLKSELGNFREQLAAREAALAQAQYAIDVLERQLIDSQHTMHAFAEERIDWEKQFTDLESRLAEYVKRIQELERQLEQVRAAKEEATPIAPVVNADEASDSTASEPVADEIVDERFDSLTEEESSAAAVDESANWEEVEVVDESASAESTEMDVEAVAEPVELATEPAAAIADEPLAESEESVADVDVALEHLQGLSIWRQEPEIAPEEDGDVGSSQATVGETREPRHLEQSSFIDRYAHLLPTEDEVVELPAAAPPARTIVEEAPADSDHEESVEQYMAKLLGRMRGTAASQSEAEKIAADAAKLPSPDDATADVDTEAEAEAETADAIEDPITDIKELRSKVGTPELAIDRMAMRALANQSARQAIGVHAARTFRRNAQSRLIVAALGASAGLYLLLIAPEWKSLQFAAGCLATFIAIYWGRLSWGTVIEAIRAGMFEDDEEVSPENSLHPPLPIDMERPRD